MASSHLQVNFFVGNTTIIDMGNPVKPLHHAMVVGDDQDSGMVFHRQLFLERHDVFTILGVERDCRLIGQDHVATFVKLLIFLKYPLI